MCKTQAKLITLNDELKYYHYLSSVYKTLKEDNNLYVMILHIYLRN